MSTLYLIRHGQASFGKENYDMLSEKGVRQSELLGEYLADLKIAFDSVYTGPLVRHRGTELALRKAMKEKGFGLPEAVSLSEWTEYDSRSVLEALIPELLSEDPSYKVDAANLFADRKSFQRVFEAAMYKWSSGEYRAQNLMPWREFVAIVYRGLDTVMKRDGRGKRVAVITSGGPVSVAVGRALGLSEVNTMRVAWQIKNSSVTRFKCTETDIMLESFNEVHHLERTGEGGLVTYR